MKSHGIILFHTTSSAIRAEKILMQAGLSVKLVPTPREFSSDCGIAVRFDGGQLEQVKLILHEAKVETAGIHQA